MEPGRQNDSNGTIESYKREDPIEKVLILLIKLNIWKSFQSKFSQKSNSYNNKNIAFE